MSSQRSFSPTQTGSLPGGSSGRISPVSSASSPPPEDDLSAIVGMACRVPGAQNPSKLWENIVNKRDMQKKMPEDRFNVDAFYNVDGANKGTTNAKYGYFLDQDLGDFDASFFGISGNEAKAMDPQQRLLLEVVYEALENAGITMDEISGSQTSVFCGCFTNDYNSMTTKDLMQYPKYTVTGTGNAILSNRISYFYNLHGASATLDTACSSSLVAFHMGVQSLKNKEADMSIIVGSALHFDPNIFITMTDLGMLSTDGRCRAFDAEGSGYVRGEGICAVILKRTSEAESHGDEIRALIRNTAANHDGLKQGITLPNSEAQEMLIRQTYASADCDPADTQYFEAHGTGTKAGDPRETRAIGSVFAKGRDSPLYVGSVKTNVGHLEGASGLAGIIKTTMGIEKGQIPPNMHFNKPNPEVKFSEWNIAVPQDVTPWKAPEGLARRASINSFGYGGSNAHVILEEYQPPIHLSKQKRLTPDTFADMVSKRPYLLPLTSHTKDAGKLMADRISEYLESHPDVSIDDVIYTLSTRRTMHGQRSFAIGRDNEELIKNLAAPMPAAEWTNTKGKGLRLGFVFTGQGGQWPTMGKALIQQSPLFKQTLARCDAILATLPDCPDWSFIDELCKPKEQSRLYETRFSQPICTAIQLALVDQLKQWGIHPTATVGHSSGEMGAAYAAGVLSFESALIAAYYRGVYMSNNSEGANTTGKGSMMAVGLTEAEGLQELKAYEGRVCIAAVNSPSSLTLSGDEDAILELKDKLTERKVFARPLAVAQAFHSHHMYPLAPAYQKALEDCSQFSSRESTCRMFSSVTARVADGENMGPAYWAKNMTSAVRFSDALTGILLNEEDDLNVDCILEVGPHPALKGPARQVLQGLKIDIPYVGTLARGSHDYESLLTGAGQLFALGYDVDLVAANQDQYMSTSGSTVSTMKGEKVNDLPSYAWKHQHYWAETRPIKRHRLRQYHHSMLGSPVPDSVENNPRWRNYLRQNELTWLQEHVVDGKVIFPGAGYMSMAIEAALRVTDRPDSISGVQLMDVVVKSALVVSDSEVGTEVLLELKPVSESAKNRSDSWYEFSIFSYDDSERCNEHCSGIVSVESGPTAPVKAYKEYPAFADLQKKSNRCVAASTFYHHLDNIGLSYGDHFRLLNGSLESGEGFACAPLNFRPSAFPDEANDAETLLHPTLLDSCFHIVFPAIESLLGRPLDEPFVPTFIRSLKISGAFAARDSSVEQQFHVASFTRLPSPRVAVNDLSLQSKNGGQLMVEMNGLEVKSLGGDDQSGPGRSLFFRQRWSPAFDLISSQQSIPTVQNLSGLVDAFAHQHPNSKILHINSSVDVTKEVLKTLGGYQGARRRFGTMHLHSWSKDITEDYQDLVNERAGLLEVVQPKEEEYDVVIASEDTEDPAAFLRPQGIYIAHERSAASSEGLSHLFSTKNCAVFQKEPQHEAFEDLAIIMPSAILERTTQLANALQSACNLKANLMTFADLADSKSMPKNAAILSTISEKIDNEKAYKGMQKLFTNQEPCNYVMITQSAVMESANPDNAMAIGLARTARSENDSLRLVTLDISPQLSPENAASHFMTMLDSNLQEDEFAERDGVLYIPKVEADDVLNSKLRDGFLSEPQPTRLGDTDRPLSLTIGKVGLLETLHFKEDEEIIDTELGDDEVELSVRASAVNFRDVAASMGIIDDYVLGDECAGVVQRVGSSVDPQAFSVGDRVVAWRPGHGAHRTVVRNPANLCYRLQDGLPFGVAAAMPLILTTAHFSLIDTARLSKGETVLIHAGAGGVGQMAIQIAKNVGANVITTCGSQTKRDMLKEKYGLEDSQILNDRDDSFAREIMKRTNGRGVDVALNSLAGKLLMATWNIMAPFGRFVEIGKKDIHANTKLEMGPFARNVSFNVVDLVTMFAHNKPLGARVFKECCQLVHGGYIHPPEAILEVSYEDAQKGFRLLQMGKHTGKVVLVPHKSDVVPAMPATFRKNKIFDANKTYLLVGGLGGLGRALAEWMMRKGANNIAFLSRSGADRPEAKTTVDWLESRGMNVQVIRGDITDLEDTKKSIQSVNGHLAGIFQAAMVLQDAPLDSMTFQQWQTCIRPKVDGAWHLHQATQGVDLDFFVCFSSVATTLGSKGQANYSAANYYLDSLMRYRREQGLAGTSMNVGAITGVGVVAQNIQLQRIMERLGMDLVNEEELLCLIEEAVTSDKSQKVSPRGVDMHQLITGVNLAREDLYWASKPLLRNLYANHDFNDSGNSGPGKSLASLIQAASSQEEKTSILLEGFIEKVGAVLAVPAASIVASNPLSAYGLDSIVAVEFRKWFRQVINIDMPLFNILGSPSIQNLVSKALTMIVEESASDKKEEKKQSKSESAGPADEEDTSSGSTQQVIGKADLSQPIPMSTFQERIWFVHNFLEDKSFFNLPIILYFKGKPDLDNLTKTFQEMVNRNAILKTAHFEGDEFAEQRPLEDYKVDIRYKDVSKSQSPRKALDNQIKRQRREELNIEEGEVFNATLVKTSEDEYTLVCMFHHIAVDRGSSQPWFNRMIPMYDALKEGSDITGLHTPEVSYADFTTWHNALMRSPEVRPDIDFWKKNLKGSPDASKLLPFAKQERPQRNDFARSQVHTQLGWKLVERMKRISGSAGATPFHFLLAAFRTFMLRYTEDEDLTILMIDGNRPHTDVEEVTGFFVNMIPIRCQDSGEATFDQMLAISRDRTLEAMSHSNIPFDKIADTTGKSNVSSHFPISQVALNYQIHGAYKSGKTQDFEITNITSEDIPTACDLSLEAMEESEKGLNIRLEYSSTLYSGSDMDRFLDNFLTFLTSSIKDHRQPVTEISMCGPKEYQHLVHNYFNTKYVENTWGNRSVLDKIFSIAQMNPDATAVETSEGGRVSYAELTKKASRIGAALKQAGATPGDCIGLLSKPGIQAIASMLGILLNRCCYVSLDPDFAAERLAFMVNDCGAKIVLKGEGLNEMESQLKSKAPSQLKMVEIERAASYKERLTVPYDQSDADPFYMIYTSGSTGKPKGVMLNQANTQQSLSTLHSDYGFTSKDKFLQQSSICFDLSVIQIFSALTSGASVCVASRETRKDPSALADFMKSSRVSVTYFTPTQFALLLEHNNEALRKCRSYRVAFFAGERLPVRVARAFYDLGTPATLYNTWSPSELVVQTTIHKTQYPEKDATSIPIGWPMANCRHYICDAKLNPLPAGLVGEICVGGAQVGVGYLNRPDANAKSFVNDRFCSQQDRAMGWTKMFRTGDKGAFRRDGQLDFHGRIAGDKQIKLRGYRIDLGEVEQKIFEASRKIDNEGIVDVSVVARAPEQSEESLMDDRQLIAFVVPRNALSAVEQTKYATKIHEAIGKELNPYMLPNGYQPLENLPVTIGGKVDRQNLLSRPLSLVQPSSQGQPEASSQQSKSRQASADGDSVVDQVLRIFRGVLPSNLTINADDNFFQAGGQSILLLRAQSKMKRAFGVAPSLPEMLKKPTPSAIAHQIEKQKGVSRPREESIEKSIDWEDEATLPKGAQYTPRYGTTARSRNDISKYLLTGVDSFIGIHMLVNILATNPEAEVFVMGSTENARPADILAEANKYKLLADSEAKIYDNSTVTDETLKMRMHVIPGNLRQPHFGLTMSEFATLGHTIHAIYHLGTEVSLLKNYSDLKQCNVQAVLDIIELASLGEHLTEMHYLSTWSVPHLQAWSMAKCDFQEIITAEAAPTHFTPPPTEAYGYFKTRWAAESLFTQASERDFPVTIYRASAVTASTQTKVTEPSDGFIGRFILGMIGTGLVPRIGLEKPEFAVDFIPIDYLTTVMHDISSHEGLRRKGLGVYHVGNPAPLKLRDLPGLIPKINPSQSWGKSVPAEQWLNSLSKGSTDDEQVQWGVLNDYMTQGHRMFALDRAQTDEALQQVGDSVSCPPIDEAYLRQLWESHSS